jgi:Chaperone of endosialidase
MANFNVEQTFSFTSGTFSRSLAVPIVNIETTSAALSGQIAYDVISKNLFFSSQDNWIPIYSPSSIFTTVIFDEPSAFIQNIFPGGTITIQSAALNLVNTSGVEPLRFYATNGNYVAFQAPVTVPTNVTWTLPASDGTPNQTLATNGSGVLFWITGGGGGSTALSAIVPGISANTIDSLNFPQMWNWSTASTQSPFIWSANALSSGTLFSLNSSTTTLTGNLLSLTLSGSGAGNTGSVLNINSSGAASTSVCLSLTQAGNANLLTGSTPNAANGFSLIQTTAATSGANNNSPVYKSTATYWNGASSSPDVWSRQIVLGAGANPTSTYSLIHTGSTGVASVQLPAGAGLLFPGSSSGTVGFKPAAANTSVTWQLPAADGTVNQFLQTNGAGVLTFASGPSPAPGGVTGDVQFNNAGTFGGSANLFWNNASGFLGIGTASPTVNLDVVESVAGYVAIIENTINAATGNGIQIIAGSTTTPGANLVNFSRTDAVSLGGIVQDSTTSVNFVTTSDERVKENIKSPEIDALDIVNSINVREFNFKDDNKKIIGMIAQELLKVYPDAVYVPEDEKELLSIKPMTLIPILILAIQQLSKK